ALGHENLVPLLRRGDERHPPPVGRRAFPDIDRDIEDRASDHSYKLVLCLGRRLVMEAAQHEGGGRERMIVLHPGKPDAGLRELRLRMVLGKKPPPVAELVRDDLEDFRNAELYDLHYAPPAISATRLRR